MFEGLQVYNRMIQTPAMIYVILYGIDKHAYTSCICLIKLLETTISQYRPWISLLFYAFASCALESACQRRLSAIKVLIRIRILICNTIDNIGPPLF